MIDGVEIINPFLVSADLPDLPDLRTRKEFKNK